LFSIKREWTIPSTILFATECPVIEKNFAYALAQAKESGARLILLHLSNDTAQTPKLAARAHGTATHPS
jgi:hypothetical protein